MRRVSITFVVVSMIAVIVLSSAFRNLEDAKMRQEILER